MSDPWQYRIRVRGPDRDAWWARATAQVWGPDLDSRDDVLIEWPMEWNWNGERRPAASTWYNVRTENSEGNDYAEFFGNFSGAPGLYFGNERSDMNRWGPPAFGDLNIEVEIIGHTWHGDTASGVYSYRDTFVAGKKTSSEAAEDASVAERHAPELLTEFPDHLTAEERAERDDPEDEPAPPPLSFPRPAMTACDHGIPFEDLTKDNGCPKCANEVRMYLSGLVKRSVL